MCFESLTVAPAPGRARFGGNGARAPQSMINNGFFLLYPCRGGGPFDTRHLRWFHSPRSGSERTQDRLAIDSFVGLFPAAAR